MARLAERAQFERAEKGRDDEEQRVKANRVKQDEAALLEHHDVEQAGPARPPIISSLRTDYEVLSTLILPYKELRRRTNSFNRRVKDAYALTRDGSQYTGLRLDAEHFIDARFFAPFRSELAALGIRSPREMPAFAVHYEYHLRSPETLSEGKLDGVSLTQEKLTAMPHDRERERFPTLVSLLESFATFWQRKGTVQIQGESKPIGASYWHRLQPEFDRLLGEARRRGL
jgi:hypothetical protein